MNKVKNGYKLIAYYLSLFIIFIGFILLLPLFMLIFYPNELPYAYCFIIPGIGSIIIGFILFFIFKNCEKKNLERHQDAVFVVSIWLIAILFASFPFLLKGDNTFTQCIFEACSGFSTTGFTILDVEMTPYIFLFFFFLLIFDGGVGLILIITCSISDRFGLRLYNAEGHNDKLLPNIAKSARIIFLFYFVFILVGTVALILCKVDPFDAFSHAIAAVSTGGFSTKNNCIAFYDNVWVEIILCILMILGGTSFVIHLSFFKGKFKNVFFDGEVRFLYITLLIAIPLGALLLLNNCVGIEIDSSSYLNCLRISGFNLISAITTTGFSNVSFGSTGAPTLPYAFYVIVILFMLIGGCNGSTSGGIKIYRVVVAIKSMWYSIKDKMSNKRLIKTHFYLRNGNYIEMDKNETNSILTFILVYFVIFFFGSFLISLFGFNFGESAFEYASALGGVGLSVGIVSASANPGVLWIIMGGMFFGRLEIFIIFQALLRMVNDIRKKEC